jgi:hypothetical protein
VAAVFFWHPDESKIVEKMIATNLKGSMVFIDPTRTISATAGESELKLQWK